MYQGVIRGKKLGDWIAGIGIELKELNNGNWDYDRPEHETQNDYGETWGCTVFSALDALETLFMWYLHNQKMPPEHVQWLTQNGYFNKGFINFSDGYTYKFADIQPGLGTYLYSANNALLKGLVPELTYTGEDAFLRKNPVSEDMHELAREFNKRFGINWYWVEDPTYSLKCSPLQGLVRFANGDGILSPDGEPNHAVMVYKKEDGAYYIDDSYAQRNKRYAINRVYDFIGYQLTFYNNTMDVQKFLKDNDLKWVRNQNTGAFGRVLQNKLRVVATADRGTLILLDDKVRTDGVNIPNDQWESLPKELF